TSSTASPSTTSASGTSCPTGPTPTPEPGARCRAPTADAHPSGIVVAMAADAAPAVTATEPAARLPQLAALVAYHNRRYHELDDPEISDGDFDALVHELRELAAAHPEVEFDNPLTSSVGGSPRAQFAP